MESELDQEARTDHDRLFKELISTFFVEFLELFVPDMLLYLEADSLVALDKEVFGDVDSEDKYEADLVIKAHFKAQDAFFLIHVEHQSYDQSIFGARMFRYFIRLYEKYKMPVYPIAIFSYDTPYRPEPDKFTISFPNKEVLELRYDVVQLNRLDWRTYLTKPNPIASALMAKMAIAPADRVRVKLECLRMLAGLKLNLARTRLISGFVDKYLKLDQTERVSFTQAIDEVIPPQEKEQVMEIVTSWMEEGIVIGRQEGEVIGQHKGEVLLILRQLTRRFGELDERTEARVRSLPVANLETLSDAIFDFTSAADVVTWLDQFSQ